MVVHRCEVHQKNGCEKMDVKIFKFFDATQNLDVFFVETDPENFWEIDLSFLLTSAVKAFEPISLPSLKAALSRTLHVAYPGCISPNLTHVTYVTVSPCNQTSYINHFASYFMFLINIRDILIVGDSRASS